MRAMQEALNNNMAQNESSNSYLSKRYAEFYRLMLQPDGTTKATGPVQPPPLQ